MGGIKIKKAGINDWRTIVSIQKKDGFAHSYFTDKKRISVLMKRGEIFFLAFLNGVPAGFTSVDFEKRAMLHFLSVMKVFHNRGIGKSLLKVAKDEATKRKFKNIFIFSEAKGRIMSNFLKSQKMTRVGYWKDRYGKGRDAIIWKLTF
jgi:ribosomal protein S18 acetylase RimI-like enzyme